MKVLSSFLFILLSQFAFSQDCFVTLSSGGGFTGMATVYKISPNGNVLKGKGLGQITFGEQSKLKKNLTKKFFRQALKLVESNQSFNHPGNIYYSLGTEENDKNLKVTWGDPQHPVPPGVKELFDKVIKAVNELSFSANTSP